MRSHQGETHLAPGAEWTTRTRRADARHNSSRIFNTIDMLAKAIENISFTVYFGFDSAALTQEAQPVLQQAVAEFRRRADARMDVVGHTDRAGSLEYNRALSKRRADAVRDALAASGVTAGRIDEAALGELVADVETADGVREPLNRRVEIVVSSQ